jgi:hypothetical protein
LFISHKAPLLFYKSWQTVQKLSDGKTVILSGGVIMRRFLPVRIAQTVIIILQTDHRNRFHSLIAKQKPTTNKFVAEETAFSRFNGVRFS